MNRRVTYFLTWLGITALSVFVSTQAVGSVRDQVTTPPATLAALPSPSTGSSTPASTTTPAGQITDVTSTTTLTPTTTTTLGTTTSTSAPSGATGTTTTTIPVATPGETTTTTMPTGTTTSTTTASTTTTTLASVIATYQLTGGWVRVEHNGVDVWLVDAAPHAGYAMSVEKVGPSEVEVEFESADYEGTFEARVEDGDLVVVLDEHDED